MVVFFKTEIKSIFSINKRDYFKEIPLNLFGNVRVLACFSRYTVKFRAKYELQVL